MRENPNKRYVVADASSEDLETVIQQANILKDIVKHYTIECQSITQMRALLHSEYPAFLKYPISDWETLNNLMEIGVSDVYVDGPLGFSLKGVHDRCKEKGIKVRIAPTVSPNTAMVGLKPNSFFIRPEDLGIYEKYIDVLDFRVPKKEKEDTLFTIYKRGTFYYNLKDLLEECTFSVPNPFIKPEFGPSRLNCGQRCLVPGHSCHLCETQIQLTNLVYDYFSKKDQEQQDRHTLQI